MTFSVPVQIVLEHEGSTTQVTSKRFLQTMRVHLSHVSFQTLVVVEQFAALITL